MREEGVGGEGGREGVGGERVGEVGVEGVKEEGGKDGR